MASIVQKKNRYYVVYLYDSEDGRRKQKWESFKKSRNGSLLRRRKRPNGERQKLNTDRSLAAL